MRTPLKNWLQLLRVPNLFTVPGDPLVGFLFVAPSPAAGIQGLAAAVLAALCFYGAGLIVNDIVDLPEDRRERPGRPLASGAIGIMEARWAAGTLFAVALALCALAGVKLLTTGLGLAAAILLYNGVLKPLPVVGPISMGLCRGLSVWLGVSAGGDYGWQAVMLALTIGAYVATVTHLARTETEQRAYGISRGLPLAVLMAAFAVLSQDQAYSLREAWGFAASAGLALSVALFMASRLGRPNPTPGIIGELIRVLLPIQAAFAFRSIYPEGFACGMALLALWPISRIVGRLFYAS